MAKPSGEMIAFEDAIKKLAQSPETRIELDLQITNKYDILVKRD